MGKKKSLRSKNNQNTQPKQLFPTKKNEILIHCDKLIRLCTDQNISTELWENYLEITAVLEKVKQLEDMKISRRSQRSVAIEEFQKWLKDNGANYEGTSIAEFPGYEMGLKAEKDFGTNDLLLQIPEEIIFSCETAAPELAALQSDPLIQHMPQVALAIALLIERHKDNSKWKPYLNILPSNYCTVLYMTTNDMIELKGSPTLETALKHCRNIARQYAYFNQLFNANNNPVSQLLREVFTYEEYCWAVSTVMTRQNIILSQNGTKLIHALIPMWDMCNHEEGSITTDFNVNLHTCDCYAKRDFKTGDQIFINYGTRTNSEFFVHSGFVPKNNEEDEFKLQLGISKSERLFREKKLLLEKLGFSSTTMTFSLKNSGEPISDQMRMFLRVFNMRKSDLDHWLESDKVLDLKNRDCSLDTVVEDNIKKFLIMRLLLLMANYPTTLKEDLELFNKTMSPAKKMILQLRISEKKILKHTLDFIDQ